MVLFNGCASPVADALLGGYHLEGAHRQLLTVAERLCCVLHGFHYKGHYFVIPTELEPPIVGQASTFSAHICTGYRWPSCLPGHGFSRARLKCLMLIGNCSILLCILCVVQIASVLTLLANPDLLQARVGRDQQLLLI